MKIENKLLISVVAPAYNEGEVVNNFHEKFIETIANIENYNFEFVYVDDGSSDDTILHLNNIASKNHNVTVLSLSRNFGKEIALTAALDYAAGDAVVIFDIDLQDPAELIFPFIENWEKGYDVVYAKRSKREGESWVKKATAHMFYRLISKISHIEIPQDTGDCRLITRKVLDSLLKLREQHRYMKGLFAWVGYNSIAVEYLRNPRIAGTTKFNYIKLWNLAIEGITSFTIAPLKLATYAGFGISLTSFFYALWIILKTIIWGETVQGYPTMMVTILFLGGVQLLCIGILGEYLGRIFNETKKRTLYLLKHSHQSKYFNGGNSIGNK